MASSTPRLRRHLALAMVSAAVIAFQLALMQFLSLVQWHHFASMIIAVALLGFGAAGAVLSLLRSRLMRRFETLLPLVLSLSGASMALVAGISQAPWLRFDSLLIFTGLRPLLNLFLTCSLYLLPIFLAALAIGMIFVHAAGEIDRLYFWNLAGSGGGGAAMTGLMWLFPPPALPGLAAVMALAAALLVLPEGLRGPASSPSCIGRAGCTPPLAGVAVGQPVSASPRHPGKGLGRALVAAALLAGLAAVLAVIDPPVPVLSEFKGLSRALRLPDARIISGRNSPYGLMQLFSSPALRYAPGLTLTWQEEIPGGKAIFNNGDWFGAVVPRRGGAVLDRTTGALPYALGGRRSVLILDAGTCSLVPQALNRGAERITAIEPHPAVLSLLGGELAGETGDLLRHPAVSIRNLSSRTFLARDGSLYDLILLPTVDAFGGTSGLHAVREDYLLTREAFRTIWRKLTPGGAISVTCWMDYPLRHPLKIVSTLAEALEAEGVADLRDHLAAVRGWGTITILAKKTALTAADTANIRRFSTELRFDPALLPDLREEERMRFNALQDGRLLLTLEELLTPSRARLLADYAFNILPATDDRPYFSQFLRWRSIPELARLYGGRTFPFLEAGYLLVLMTLLQVCVVAVVLILLPLRFLGPRGGSRTSTLLYFGGLGIGYMFVEIVLIQRFLLYLGNPIYAAAVVISGMLLGSGIGSLFTRRLIKTRQHALALFTLIVLIILLAARYLTPLLLATISLPQALRIVLAVLLIAPAALLMGMPFPLGIRFLTGTNDSEIPWAWGINGCLSVVGTLLAAVIAVETGFSRVMILAAFAYGITCVGGVAGLFRPDAFRRSSG
jgi:hypothetical protein